MPGFDQTGPLGNGPTTGRGRGRCFSIPSSEAQQTPPAYGLGRGGSAYGCGMGRGAGMRNSARMGFGRRNFSSSNPVDTQELEEELARARERIETLETRLKQLKPDTSE